MSTLNSYLSQDLHEMGLATGTVAEFSRYKLLLTVHSTAMQTTFQGLRCEGYCSHVLAPRKNGVRSLRRQMGDGIMF